MDKNEFLMHITIADQSYPLRIDRKDEELARNAAKQIKMKYEHCKAVYSESDERDWLAMVAYQLSKEILLLEQRNDTAPYIEKIRKLTERLEAYLDDNK